MFSAGYEGRIVVWEIFEKKNVAAAILAGSVIIGVSLILAAAMS